MNPFYRTIGQARNSRHLKKLIHVCAKGVNWLWQNWLSPALTSPSLILKCSLVNEFFAEKKNNLSDVGHDSFNNNGRTDTIDLLGRHLHTNYDKCIFYTSAIGCNIPNLKLLDACTSLYELTKNFQREILILSGFSLTFWQHF